MKKVTSNASKVSLLASSALLLVGAGCNTTADTNVSVNAPAIQNNGAMMEGKTNVNAGAMMQGSSHYKDGVYSAIGHYKSPAGPEEIKVTLTLKGDVIVDSEVVPQATVKKSIFMQTAFAGGYKTLVIGKNIDEVNLVSSVSGSSLTPKGFNDAVAQVKEQAKAS